MSGFVIFENGEYATSDPKQIEALNHMSQETGLFHIKSTLPLTTRELKSRKKKKEASWDMNKLQPRKTKVIGSDINLDDYEIVGHLISDTVFKCPELNWSHFDWVQLIQKTNHPQVNRPRFHFLGFRSGQTSILICKHK